MNSPRSVVLPIIFSFFFFYNGKGCRIFLANKIIEIIANRLFFEVEEDGLVVSPMLSRFVLREMVVSPMLC